MSRYIRERYKGFQSYTPGEAGERVPGQRFGRHPELRHDGF